MNVRFWSKAGISIVPGDNIFNVSDVDNLYQHIVKQGLKPDFAPRDAGWNERYFHITDPDGHELSFAQRIN